MLDSRRGFLGDSHLRMMLVLVEESAQKSAQKSAAKGGTSTNLRDSQPEALARQLLTKLAGDGKA
jgi:hypothetical protein